MESSRVIIFIAALLAVLVVLVGQAFSFVLDGSSTSYAQFRKWNTGLNGTLEFEFKTDQGSGLLLYTDDGGTYDFFEIKLIESALRLRYNLGGGAQIATVGRDLGDGQWHKVQVTRNNENTTLTVDGVSATSTSRGKEFEFGKLAGNSEVYVGGMPNWYNSKLTLLALPSVIFEPRFNGIIRNLVYADGDGTTSRRQERKSRDAKFLDEHYIPRKSKSRKTGQPSTQSTLSLEERIDDRSYMSERFDDGGILTVYTQLPWEDTQHSVFTDLSDSTALGPFTSSTPQPSPVLSTPQPSPVLSTPQPSPVSSTSQPLPVPSISQPSPVPSTSQTSLVPSTSQPSPVPSTSSSTPVPPRAQSAPLPQQNLTADARPSRFRLPREDQDIPPSKRRKHSSDDAAFTGALESIVQTLKVPAMPPPSTSNSRDPSDTCGEFIASILKTLKNERLKIDVMSTLMQTLLNAKAQDVD